MTRILFLSLFLISFAKAQVLPGFHPEEGYAYEDFKLSKGIFWLPQGPKLLAIDSGAITRNIADTCIHYQDTFSYAIQRDTILQKGIVNVTQPYGKYEPIGIFFGKESGGRQRVLDLYNGNAQIGFTVKNTSLYDLQVYVSLMDSSGNFLNAVGTNSVNEGFLDWQQFILLQGHSINVSMDFNKDAYNWMTTDTAAGCSFGNPVINSRDAIFNKSAVAKLLFRVVNELTSMAPDGYKPFTIKNATLEFSNLVLGAKPIVTDVENATISSPVTIFPNPTKGSLYFSVPLEDIALLDIHGISVMESPRATSIDVGKLEKGVYMLRSSTFPMAMKIIVD